MFNKFALFSAFAGSTLAQTTTSSSSNNANVLSQRLLLDNSNPATGFDASIVCADSTATTYVLGCPSNNGNEVCIVNNGDDAYTKTYKHFVGVIKPASKSSDKFASAFIGCFPVRRSNLDERGIQESGVLL